MSEPQSETPEPFRIELIEAKSKLARCERELATERKAKLEYLRRDAERNRQLVAEREARVKAERERDEARETIDTWIASDKRTVELQDLRAKLASMEQGVESLTAQLDAVRVERDEALRKLHEIDLETEGDVDGAPDRSAVSSLCNRIQNIILQSR